MTDSYVLPATLGQGRQNDGDSMGIWRRPGWRQASGHFRCSRCRAVVPSTKFSVAEASRFTEGREPMVCDKCLTEATLKVVV